MASKIVEVPGVGNVEFPDSMSDDQIASAIRGQHQELAKQPSVLETAYKYSGIPGVIEMGKGALKGAGETLTRLGDMREAAAGSAPIADRPDVKQMLTPSNPLQSAGRAAEQLAEFAAPMGQVAKGVKALPLAGRIAAEGAAAGGISALQSGGDPGATAAGAAIGAAGPAVGAGLRAGVRAIGDSGIPERMYQSALKPTWTMFKKDAGEMLKTGLREKIPVTPEGADILEGRIKSIQQEIANGVKLRAGQGATIDSSKVLASLDDLENFYKNTAAPEEGLATIKGIKDQFLKYHGEQIPLDKAQQIKINTYQELKKAYGEMKSARVEGLKQVARGLKEQISEAYPEIAGLNERQSKLLNLDDALYRALWRIENHQMMGIGSGIAGSAGGAVMGKPGALTAFVSKLVLDDPGIKSKIAIALRSAGNSQAAFDVLKKGVAVKAAQAAESEPQVAVP